MTDLPAHALAAPNYLQQIIEALTEGIIMLGLDGTLTWADQTAMDLHGVGTLEDLGGTAAGYAERFQLAYAGGKKLEIGQYPMQRGLAGQVIDRATFEITRVSDGKHWVHETRTKVLTGVDGKPECLVVILDDETERFHAEQRFERAFAANPAPAIIARLTDMRYVKVNTGFLELTGHQQGELIGHSMHEIDVLRGAEKRDLAVKRLHAGKTIPQMEGCLQTADGGEKTVLLGGQPIEIGDDACMLFTFADLHPRERAKHALRQSEEKFAKVFSMAPGPIVILSLDELRIMDVNAAFTAATGWRREEVIGRSEMDLALWGKGEPRHAIERLVRETGRVHSAEAQLRSKAGRPTAWLLSAETIEIAHERCVVTMMLDITQRRQTETELLAAVQATMQDTSWLGQKIVEKLAAITRSKGGPAPQPELDSLSARAREVLSLMAQGLPDEDVAKRLGITRNTLRNHIAAIYAKLGMHKRAAVVLWAREQGLGELEIQLEPAREEEMA